MNINGKTAIVTGAGRGIGKAIALDLAREGCNVVIVSRSINELQQVAKEIESQGGNALAYAADLTEEENINGLISATLQRCDTIDFLINNAGILFLKPFSETTLEEWDLTMNINLRSAFLLSQKILNIMKDNKSGYIVNISSTVALGVPEKLAAYGASKCGMVGLSQALYEAGKEHGVRVSTIYPGITDTSMVRDINPPTKPEQWMLPEDISYCVMFLLKQNPRMVVRDVVPWSTGYDKI